MEWVDIIWRNALPKYWYIIKSNLKITFFAVEMVWSLVPANGLAPSARSEHSAASVGHYIWIYGGLNADEYLSDLYLFHAGKYVMFFLIDSVPFLGSSSYCRRQSFR